MPTYQLIFRADGLGEPRVTEFKGTNAASAFSVLEKERDSREVELWNGKDMLAKLVRDRSGVWTVDTTHRPSSRTASLTGQG